MSKATTEKSEIEEFISMDSIINELTTVFDYIRVAVSQLNQHDVYYGHGTVNAWQEAHSLVFNALSLPLDLDAEQQSVFYKAKLSMQERQNIYAWLKLRCVEKLPLPYITKQAWFCGMPFYVDERVLIPRSPFAELINDRFKDYLDDNTQPNAILDMCTGGGCIAIALAMAFEQAEIDAVDIDANALELASLNISEYQLDNRVFPIQSDLFTALGSQKYDLIVVNPPYVDIEDMQDLPTEYQHEPRHALESGDDGLDLTAEVLKQALKHLNENAWLFIEVGNSEVNFSQRFGGLDVHWCELKLGGSGIFAINQAQLKKQITHLKNL